jgi:hypothetical protein
VWALFLILSQPPLQICLEFFSTSIELLAEHKAIELSQEGLVEAFADAIGLRALPLGAGMVDMLDRQIQLVLLGVQAPTVLGPSIGYHAAQGSLLGLKEGHDLVVEQVSCRPGGLAIRELGKGHLAVGVNKGLLLDPAHAFERADIEGVLGATLAWTFAPKLALGLLINLCLLSGGQLGLGEERALPGPRGL